MTVTVSNPYQILGVSPTATDTEIRDAFRRVARAHHPDRGGDEAKFKEVTAAFKAIQGLTRKCPDCDGSSFIVVRNGVFVSREECPTCWKLKK